MSDPVDVLGPGLKAWLEADAEVIAAFASKAVKVFDEIPPADEHYPYVFLAGLDPDDATADCYDAAEVNVQADVWARSRTVARRIAKAVKASIVRCEDTGDSPAFTLAGQRVVAVQPLSTQYLNDPSDGRTIHAVIRATLSVDPTDP